jgi:hypothetical protein
MVVEPQKSGTPPFWNSTPHRHEAQCCNVLLAADTLSPPSCLPVKLQKIDTYENIAILQKIPIYMLISSLVHQHFTNNYPCNTSKYHTFLLKWHVCTTGYERIDALHKLVWEPGHHIIMGTWSKIIFFWSLGSAILPYSWSLFASYFQECLLDCFIYILTNWKKHMQVMYAGRNIYIALREESCSYWIPRIH